MLLTFTGDTKKLREQFLEFRFFRNHIDFVLKDEQPVFYVDESDHSLMVMYAKPAYYITGTPSRQNAEKVKEIVNQNSWLIPEDQTWYPYLLEVFGEGIIQHERLKLSAAKLDLEKVRELKQPIPPDFQIVPITSEHLVEGGMINDDVLKRYYHKRPFIENGTGFALVKQGVIHGFALANYPFEGNELEVYYRVGYESFQKYRRLGLGTQLAVTLVEWCLEQGIVPTWDAATEISSHIAEKIGYVPEEKWSMFHVL